MELYVFCIIVLGALAVFDLMVGVSNDAVNFLNSSIGSRVAPRHIIMIIAGLGILAGVTFSSGMMEVARKGIFHPRYFLMPELITIFLAVMIADVLLLDLFNTFGLPTSTTVSIVFELLGAAVAISLLKIHVAGDSYVMLTKYINTAKALAIIMGILLSVVVAFFCGLISQFITRLVFTFDYVKRLRRYGGIWGGIALSVITYFILIKGAKGTSFLSPEVVLWIKTNAWLILSVSFLLFSSLFHLLMLFTRVNVLKPIVLIGTFALAMAFAANDLVNFIGVPLAGLSAYHVAESAGAPLAVSMEALERPVQSSTFLLLVAGGVMVATLWLSRKARTVTLTEVNLARQDEGIERFGSSFSSRVIVGLVRAVFGFLRRLMPVLLRKAMAARLDPGKAQVPATGDGIRPSFDLLRASVNLVVASAIISLATSLKLPLSTTYVTFMVGMGTSLADQAWGRESAVYRVTGVITVIGGWFFTAIAAFTTSFVFALLIHFLKLSGILGLLIFVTLLLLSSYRYHLRREKERREMEAFDFRDVTDPSNAIVRSFEQTGHFLKDISDNLDACYEAAASEDLERLRATRGEAERIEKETQIIIGNIFETLSFLHKEDIDRTLEYSKTIGALQSIAASHRDMVVRTCEHFANYHSGFTDAQKQELRRIKTLLTRLLWNTSIMLLRRKKVDYDYVSNQCERLREFVPQADKNQIERIQRGESKTRLSILFYGLLENSLRIAEETRDLLAVFKESFEGRKRSSSSPNP
ncbi:MAG: inorganic phosphate transporter [Deltaproteobacteria bacterium]|nr:inorganic phosphate transporter [Deltaproteobacteria bacterium]